MDVIVGVGGRDAKIAAGEGNTSELMSKKPSGGSGSRDEKGAAVGKPRRFKVNAIFRNRYLFRLTAGCIHGKESAEIVRSWLNDGNHDGLAIGGPGERQAIGENVFVVEEIALERAIAPGDLEIGDGGIAMLVQVGEALTIGREGDGAVDVLDQKTRCSAEHWSVVEGSNGLLGIVASNEIDVIAIGGEGKTAITGGRGRDGLRVASGGTM